MFLQTITSSLLQVFKQVTTCSSRKGIVNEEMGKYKTNVIQADLDIFNAYSSMFRYPSIFRHIQTYLGIIQAYSEPCVTLTYSELWYIHNSVIFKTRGIFKTAVYPKL